MTIPKHFQAFRIHNDEDGYRAGIDEIGLDDLSEGQLVIRAHYSSVNYKDALAGTGKGKILRHFPLVGGIDVGGHVVATSDKRFKEGDAVLVTGCEMGQLRDGGFAEYARLDADSVIPLPERLSLREAMGLGTAGFTAALCLERMQTVGQTPEMGPVVVTGATGGVGTLAVDIFTRAGFEVHAITGKVEHFRFLQELGAQQCISRHKLYWGQRPLESAMWAGAVDNVGGEMLEGLTRVIKPWGNIASCGMAGGLELHTTVMPLIIRGNNLLGINSEACPMPIRQKIWQKLAGDWRPTQLDRIITHEIELPDLAGTFDQMLAGKSFGRTVVRLAK
jgi:putative YhdH/YhfP family quinone oxidoreductase